MKGGIFGSSSGGVVIAGHHISYGLLAVLLSVPVAGLAIYQFRSGAIGGGGAVNTGTGTPVDAGQGTGVSGGGGGSDAALAAINGNLASLTALLQGMSAYSQPAAPGPSYISNSYTTITKAADIPRATGTPARPAFDATAAAAAIVAALPSLAPAPPPANPTFGFAP